MWIEIKKDVFEESDIKGINYLFQILSWYPTNSIPRYEFVIDYNEVADVEGFINLSQIENIGNENNNFMELLQIQFNRWIENGMSNTQYVISNIPSDNAFTIEEAIRFFSQPVSILLENAKNDAFFIGAIIEHFDNTRVLNEHIKNGWIQFDNAGGCTNIKNVIDARLESFRDLPASSERYLRYFVLFDSDKLHEQDELSDNKKTTIIYLNEHNIAYKVLDKRSMENYMPTIVFNDIDDLVYQSWIEVYQSLTSTQMDFLNISKGFCKKKGDGTPSKSREQLNAETMNIYKDLSDAKYDVLNNGLSIPDFKHTFPQKFSSSSITKQNLKERANSNELEEILEKIKNLL